jgi:hypothetical protein
VLPPAVQELLTGCFEDAHTEPALRPTAAQWQHALEEAEAELCTCPAHARHVYPRGLDACPWCALARQQGRDPFPAPEAVAPPVREASPPRRPRTIAAVPLPTPGPFREDPLPPRPEPAAPVPAADPGWVEAGLQGVGAAVERRGWLVWLGVALVGAVSGLLWALAQASGPPAKDKGTPPGREATTPVSSQAEVRGNAAGAGRQDGRPTMTSLDR